MKGIGIVRSKRETLPITNKTNPNLGPGHYNVSQSVSSNTKLPDKPKQYINKLRNRQPAFMTGETRVDSFFIKNPGFPGPGQYNQTIRIRSRMSQGISFYTKVS